MLATEISARGIQAQRLRVLEGKTMIILGIILIIIGALANIPVLYSIGIILAVIGIVLWILGSTGRAVGGRNHYW